jgi:hypothetical protein
MIVPLKPPLDGIAAERFLALARELKRSQRKRHAIDFQQLCDAEVKWCHSHPYLNGNAIRVSFKN